MHSSNESDSSKALHRTLLARGVELEPPATKKQLALLEDDLQHALPPGIRAYLELFNGMPNGGDDGDFMRIWGVREMREHLSGRGSGQLAFADFLIASHFYVVDVRTGSVAIDHTPPTIPLGSWGRFVERYCTEESPIL